MRRKIELISDFKMRPLNITQHAQIVALLRGGFSQTYVATRIDVNQSAVCRILAHYRHTGGFEPRRQGWRQMTIAHEDRAIRHFAAANSIIILLAQLTKQLCQGYKLVQISPNIKKSIVRRRLKIKKSCLCTDVNK